MTRSTLFFTTLTVLVWASSASAASEADLARQYLQNTRAMIGRSGDGEIINQMTIATTRAEPLLGANDPDLVTVKADLAAMKLKKRCTELGEPIERTLRMGSGTPTAAELDAWAAAIDAFVKGATPDLQTLAAAESAKPEKARAELARREQEKDSRARQDAEAKEAQLKLQQQQAARAQVVAIEKRANEARWAAEATTAKGEDVTAAQLAALEAAAVELDGLQSGRGEPLREQARAFERLAQWSKPDPAAQQAIASALSAELVARGTVMGKSFSTSFKVKAGQCYLFLARFDRFSGDEEASALVLSASGSSSVLQPFSYAPTRDGLQRLGLCATAASSVTVKSTLSFAGTKNGLRFAVLGWARAQVPVEVTRAIILGPIDDCDAVQWRSLWKEPVPGTLAFADGEPFLVVERRGRTVEVLDVATGKQTLNADKLSDTRPAKVVFRTQFLKRTPRKPGEPITVAVGQAAEYWCAPDEKTPSADAKALFQCGKAVEAKFARAYADLDRVREQAARMGGVAPRAEAMRNQLDADYDAENRSRCGPIEQRITSAMERTYNALVDDF